MTKMAVLVIVPAPIENCYLKGTPFAKGLNLKT